MPEAFRNQPRQPDEQQTIGVVEGRSPWRLAPEHVDLLAKNQISASRRALDWNSPISAPKSNLSSWTIEQQHHPIRTGSPAVWSFRQGHREEPQQLLVISVDFWDRIIPNSRRLWLRRTGK